MTQDQLEYHGVYVAFIATVALVVVLLAVTAAAEVIRDHRARGKSHPSRRGSGLDTDHHDRRAA